jgi:uncharacterized protein involved in exopolysaccharide biosynthesis
VSDKVLSQANLATIIEKHDLYAEERGDRPAESVVREMRPNIKLEMTLDDDDPRNKRLGEVMGFTVSFYYPDARKSQEVTQELADLFVEASATRTNEAVAEAKAVAASAATALREKLKEQEAKLAEFKKQNPGVMPADRDFNMQQLIRRQGELDNIDRQIRDLQNQIALLTTQLATTDPFISATAPSGDVVVGSLDQCRALQSRVYDLLGRYSSQHPDVVQARRQLEQVCGTTGAGLREALQLQLATRRAELDSLRQSVGEEHPDVRALERLVQRLEEDIRNTPAQAAGRQPDNPAYLQLSVRQSGLRTEVSALRGQRNALVTQIKDLEDRLERVPDKERELAELNRGYKEAEDAFQAAERRVIDLDRERLTETWILHSRSGRPYKPAFPNRPLIAVVGILLGFTLAALIILVLETVDGTIRGTRDVSTLMDMPPIAAVPFVMTQADRAKARTRGLATGMATTAAIVLTVVYVYLQRVGTI